MLRKYPYLDMLALLQFHTTVTPDNKIIFHLSEAHLPSMEFMKSFSEKVYSHHMTLNDKGAGKDERYTNFLLKKLTVEKIRT